MTAKQDRPGGRAVAEKIGPGENLNLASTILPSVADACEAFAVVVITQEPDGDVRFSRRLYLSLHSAQKAIRRAEDRGRRASLVLCRLTPVQSALTEAWWSE